MSRPANFGTFDGKDNRKELFRMLKRLEKGCSEEQAKARRACFLSGLLQRGSGMAKKGLIESPNSTLEAFAMLVGITGVPAFGINIETAAKCLEKAVRS